MEDQLLDDTFGKVKFVQYTQIPKEKTVACVQLLEEHNIKFHLYPIDYSDKKDVIFALIKGFDIKKIHPEDVDLNLYIQESALTKLDKLVNEHPDFDILNKNAERKLFFETAYDSEGLLGILALPEDWSAADLEIVRNILQDKKVAITEEELQKAKQYTLKRASELTHTKQQAKQIIAIVLLILSFLTILFNFQL